MKKFRVILIMLLVLSIMALMSGCMIPFDPYEDDKQSLSFVESKFYRAGGKEYVGLFFDYTNETGDSKSAWSGFGITVFQNGTQLDSMLILETIEGAVDSLTQVQSGSTVRVVWMFVLNSNSSISVEVTDGQKFTLDYEPIVENVKLPLETFTFDNLELTIGEYSFVEIDNEWSEHYGKTVVKVPVTIKNISNGSHKLNSYYCGLYSPSGIESEDMWILFSDNLIEAENLQPNASYTKYFHILYDGDGVYKIVFDNEWYDFDEKVTVEINVAK